MYQVKCVVFTTFPYQTLVRKPQNKKTKGRVNKTLLQNYQQFPNSWLEKARESFILLGKHIWRMQDPITIVV